MVVVAHVTGNGDAAGNVGTNPQFQASSRKFLLQVTEHWLSVERS